MSDVGGVLGWLDVLGCPYCRGPLRLDVGDLRCDICTQRFPVQDGTPLLVRHEDAPALADFARRYRQARLREGWRPLAVAQAQALPYGSPPGYTALYWEVRRQSYHGLVSHLASQGPRPDAGPVADLGAGTGWLSHRLAEVGYRVLALDSSLEQEFGLGAAAVYWSSTGSPFLPVLGDLENPPVQDRRLSLALFNASLHYASDLVQTVQRVADSLKDDGWLIILDTPITSDPRSTSRQAPRGGTANLARSSIGRAELEDALFNAGLRARWIPIRRGPRWWIHRAKTWLKRGAGFAFPMVAARRR